MATIWRSHQVCKRCGWAGITRAHRLNVLNGFLYAIAVFVVLVLEGAEVIDLRHSIKWPAAAAALFWVFALPWLMWQTNACGGCRQRMVAKLLPGHAPSSTPPQTGPS